MEAWKLEELELGIAEFELESVEVQLELDEFYLEVKLQDSMTP